MKSPPTGALPLDPAAPNPRYRLALAMVRLPPLWQIRPCSEASGECQQTLNRSKHLQQCVVLWH